MKFLKTFVITLLSLFLTGCYTQLEYSQSMKKITDREKNNDTPEYSWSGEEKAETSDKTNEELAESEDQPGAGEQDIPVYYKDYEYTTKYGDVYNFYGNDWYGYGPYSRFGSYYSWNPFYYDRWAYHSFYGRWYDRPRFAFTFSIGWGSPFYHGFYDPFFDPYYSYWHHYYSPYAFNYHYFYRKSGYGFGYYPDKKVRENQNVRYGPRSIGTNRVVTDGNRSRSVTNSSRDTIRNRTTSTSTVRTRSGVTSRTRNNEAKYSTRNRSRDSNKVTDYDYRSRDGQYPIVIDEKQLEQIRSRNRISENQSNNLLNRARINNNRDRTPTFFNRVRSFLQDNTGRISNGSSSIRTRAISGSSTRGTYNRNSGSTNRSSVTKSKSTSSNSRARSNSSSSRSRSGGSSSDSGSDRSRGN